MSLAADERAEQFERGYQAALRTVRPEIEALIEAVERVLLRNDLSPLERQAPDELRRVREATRG